MCIVALQPMQNSTSKCFEHVSSLGLSCPPAVHISAQSLPKHFPVRSVPKRFRINLHMRPKHTKATEHLVQCYRNQRNTENMNSRIAGEGKLDAWLVESLLNAELIRFWPFLSFLIFLILSSHPAPWPHDSTTTACRCMQHLYAQQVEGGTDAQRIDAHQVQEDLATGSGFGRIMENRLTLAHPGISWPICWSSILWYALMIFDLLIRSDTVIQVAFIRSRFCLAKSLFPEDQGCDICICHLWVRVQEHPTNAKAYAHIKEETQK